MRKKWKTTEEMLKWNRERAMKPKRKRRHVLGVGYPDFCCYDNAICLHDRPWRTEHSKLKWPRYKADKKYRLILEEL